MFAWYIPQTSSARSWACLKWQFEYLLWHDASNLVRLNDPLSCRRFISPDTFSFLASERCRIWEQIALTYSVTISMSPSGLLRTKVRKSREWSDGSFRMFPPGLGHAARTHASRISRYLESTQNYRDHLKMALVGAALSRQRT